MSVNFNSTTPAAPTGSVNCTWAYDGSANASASLPVMTGDTGSGGSAGLVPAPPSGSAASGMFLRADGIFAVPAAMQGDDGSGGAAGYAPAPASGDAAAGKYLKADGTWEVPPTTAAPSTFAGSAAGLVPAATSDNATQFLRGDGTWAAVATGSGSSSSASVRGSAFAGGSGGSVTVSLPTGSAAGDFAVIFGGNAYGLTTPSGWSQIDNETGANWNGFCAYKTLSSSDITTGSVTVSSTQSSTGVLGLAVLTGTSFTVPNYTAQRNGSNLTVTSNSDVQPSDFVLMWGSDQAITTASVSIGTAMQSGNTASSGTGALYYTTGQTGAISPTFSFGAPGSGNYEAIVVVRPSSSTGSGTSGGPVMRCGGGNPNGSFSGGNPGDYYLDITAKVMYGPLASGSWPTIGSL